MAKSIYATIKLKDDGFTSGLQSAAKQLTSFGSNTKSSTSGLKSFASQSSSAISPLKSLAKTIAGVVTAYAGFSAIKNFATSVIETGMEFESSMANVSAICGATGDDLDALSEKAKEMGSTTKYTATEAADAFSYMAMAGWKTEDMISGIDGIMSLAAASGEDLASVSDIVTDSLTAFGLSAEDSSRFADILAAASSNANTNVALLGESFTNCAPTAGAMGYSVEDVTTALGIMANAGIKGSSAGTSLNSVMTRLAKPTSDVTKALNALDISAVNSDGTMKSLSDLIPELQTKFANLSESERGEYATMIAGKNAMSGFLALVNSSTDDWNSLSDAINNADGTAQNMADTLNNTVSGQLTLLESQFDGVKISIFDSLGSSKFIDVLHMASDLLTDLTPTIENVAVGFGNKIFDAIDAVKTILDECAPSFDAVKDAIDRVSTAFSTAFGGETSSLIDNISGAIDLVCSGLETALDVIAFVIDNWNIFGPIIEGVTASIIAYKVAVTAINAVTKVWAVVQGVVNAVMEANPAVLIIMGIIVAIGLVVAAIMFVKNNWDTICNALMTAWNAVKDFFVSIGTAIGSFFTDLWNGIVNAVTSAFDWIVNTATGAWNGIVSIFSGVASWFGGIFSAAWTMVTNAFSGVVGFFQGIWETIKGMFTTIGTTIADGISGAFKTVINSVIGFVQNLINGFISGINLAIDVINAIPGVNITKLTEVSLPQLANGGYITQPGSVMVGERGPEILNLPAGASVVPLNKAAANGGGNTFYITVNANGQDADSVAQTLAEKIKLALNNL